MMELPQAFKEKMERLLGAEYTEFLESYAEGEKAGTQTEPSENQPEEV